MRRSRSLSLCLVLVAIGSVATACNPAQRAKQAKQVVDSGSSSACSVERTTIQTAVDAFMVVNPDSPVSESALVSGGFIHEESKLMDVTAVGVVVPAIGTVCS